MELFIACLFFATAALCLGLFFAGLAKRLAIRKNPLEAAASFDHVESIQAKMFTTPIVFVHYTVEGRQYTGSFETKKRDLPLYEGNDAIPILCQQGKPENMMPQTQLRGQYSLFLSGVVLILAGILVIVWR